MRVAVTGGTGFIGRHLVEALVAAGHEVRVLTRGVNTGSESLKDNPSIELIEAPITNAPSIVRAIKDCEAVYHCVGINREQGDQTFLGVHVEGTRHLLSAFRQTGLKRLIMVSFLRARQMLDSPYHVTKWKSEEMIREAGLDYTIFKPGVVFGEGDQFITQLKKTILSFPFFGLVGLKSHPISPVYVGDLAKAMVDVLSDSSTFGKTYPYVGPERFTLKELVELVADKINIRPTTIPLPVFAHRLAALIMESTMKEPLLTTSQVTMLSESLSDVEPEADPLPQNLQAVTRLAEKLT
ncbi:MAG TPA: complex I NDUFA9 subunit family protein [Phycisphaerales bacterium]|nr:complex I NDUFA9 subunit family protein [Phycisphaerales bacterium]